MPRNYPTLLDLVGDTPIVRLDRISRDVPGTILAARTAWLARLDARFYTRPEGQQFVSAQRQFFRHESRYFGAELRFDL